MVVGSGFLYLSQKLIKLSLKRLLQIFTLEDWEALRFFMWMLLITIGSALICVLSRGVLNSIDRTLFKDPGIDFLSALIYNAIFPLFGALLWICLFVGLKGIRIFELHSIVGGLAAQVAGSAYSFALGKMPIRGTITVNKTADLFIPFVPFILFGRFKIDDYLFSTLSTFALLPIGYSVVRLSQISWRSCWLLIGGLLFQVAAVEFFSFSPTFSSSMVSFSQKVFSILFWRTCFILLPLFYRMITRGSPVQIFSVSLMLKLFGRGGVSLLSQMAFFWAVMGKYSAFVWPILNAGPLISCFMAHLLIKETTGLAERLAVLFFFIVVIFYFIYTVNFK